MLRGNRAVPLFWPVVPESRSSEMAGPLAKKIHRNDLIGERGIALIRRITLDMGFMFYETGGVEAGIDGFIELRDEATHEVSNLILQVQGKATEHRFASETDQGFAFLADANDLTYWLHGTAPVILLVVRVTDDTAYWVSLKDHFKDNPQALQSRRVLFDKRRDAFNVGAKGAILDVAARSVPGAVAPPARIAEEMLTNLLPVTHMGPRLYLAETGHTSNKSFGAALRGLVKHAPGEWIVKGRRVLSFHDLRKYPWDRLCDPGTSEDFPVGQWADSDDPDERRDFVHLLNRALSSFTRADLYHRHDTDIFFFKKPYGDRTRLAYLYEGLSNQTSRTVVKQYMKKTKTEEPAYFRHSAFSGRFLSFGTSWFLEVTPTYEFTSDGYKPSRFAEDHLKGIKKLENNAALIGQFLMWRHFLTKSPEDMLTTAYPFLGFGQAGAHRVERGVPDELWRSHETERDRADLFNPDGEEP